MQKRKIIFIVSAFLLCALCVLLGVRKQAVPFESVCTTPQYTVTQAVAPVPKTASSDDSSVVVDENEHHSSPFYLLVQAFSKTKQQLLISLELMAALLLVLSLILYFAEHFAQPEVYKHYPKSLLWASVKLIGDPGEMAPPKPITVTGRIVANMIGIVGIAIVAIPAGLISSGFVGAMEDEQKAIEIRQNIATLHLAFERKLDRLTGFQITPKYVSVTEIQARLGLKEDEILDAVRSDEHYRLINLALTQTAEEHPQDKLAVEHFTLNTVYGQCIDRGSKITIFSPSNIVDPIMGWWSYYLAKIGGFNYIARELGQTRPYLSFYTYKPELEIAGNQEFMADVNRLANSEDCWVFSLMQSSGSQEPTYPTQFHFNYGLAKGETSYDDPNCTLNDPQTFDNFYQSVSNSLSQNYELYADKQIYHSNDNPAFFARHLDHKVNAVSLRVAWSVTCWDMRSIKIAQELAEQINKEILGLEGNPEAPELKSKDIGYDGYTQ